jgi:methylenetetrahydrofolate dehydrogenase (NADP+)/methenyltetrahydrofolate cyclohydrolase
VVLVGEDPASVSYVTAKAKAAEEIGIFERTINMSADSSEEDILKMVDELNRDERYNGVLVQLPLPKYVSPDKVINFISPEKDVDGFHPVNVGKLLRGEPCPPPCTPYGVLQLLIRAGFSPEGRHVVICGRSNLVGKPLAALLIQKKKGANATVTVCHTGTSDLARFTLQADILVAAMGAPRVIKAEMVREGAVVIDVGVNRVADPAAAKGYRLAGDCDFEPILEKAAAITPVPGGVGPMTVTMLMMNTIESAERKAGLSP